MGEQPRRAAAQRDTAPAVPAPRQDLVHGELTGRIVRACYIVHAELGHEYLESVYEAAVDVVLRRWGISAERQPQLDVRFWGEAVGTFRPDLVVEDTVLVELKAARALAPEHHAQLLNYLRVTGLRVGLLVNFASRLEVKRFVR